jgi:endonuclease YncB( thermonuclease family)
VSPGPAPAYGPYRATLDAWHDGDTAHMTLDLGFGLHLAASCRCWGINAPELATPQGPLARDQAARLVPPGSQVVVTSHGWDKYGGRFLGAITIPPGGSAAGQDFGQVMIATGYAKAYFGTGPKPT